MRAFAWKVPIQRFPVCLALLLILIACTLTGLVSAQTDCADGNGTLDNTPPKGGTPEELITKFAAQETKVRDARSRYTYTQDVLIQTLNGTAVDGQFHEISEISYDDKGKRIESVKFSEVPTLQGVQLSASDKDDISTFMPWILTADQ